MLEEKLFEPRNLTTKVVSYSGLQFKERRINRITSKIKKSVLTERIQLIELIISKLEQVKELMIFK